ncbi:MAG TPA: metalloregulator ArsR/SmtB family transcription factor [Gemmatimonadaceae bacterium]|jgi:DNA-binding transcriptional ArsR family regulator|nr:metalloregulator ArsR/SmtB family transcription factor [Gemmatimonadaceae bacterium]
MVYSDSLDRTFGALADPTRRAILARLAAGDRSISELASRFDMTLVAVSKHVRVLERAGLAEIRREGRSRRTRLVAAPMREAREWIDVYRRFWERQLDQLAAFLEQPSPEDSASCPPTPQPRSQAPTRPSKSAASSARRGSASSRRGPRRRT